MGVIISFEALFTKRTCEESIMNYELILTKKFEFHTLGSVSYSDELFYFQESFLNYIKGTGNAFVKIRKT